MEADSHTQRDQTLVLKTGKGTMEFPMEQVADISPLPDLPTPLVDKKAAAALAVMPPLNAEELLIRAAISEGLEPEFVRSVARIESANHQDAVSVKGAIGLMQLMPSTAATLGVDAKLAEENAQGGAKFLRELLLRYHGDATLALAAYNAGPGAVQKYKGVPPYLETRRYIVKVLQEYARLQKLQAAVVPAAPVIAR